METFKCPSVGLNIFVMPRPRTPTVLRILQGNPAPRPLPADEQQPAPLATLDAPKHFGKRAKDAWKIMASPLNNMGVLTKADAPALERLCQVGKNRRTYRYHRGTRRRVYL